MCIVSKKILKPIRKYVEIGSMFVSKFFVIMKHFRDVCLSTFSLYLVIVVVE